ncbi:PrsW family glutamic-type intramembrane protease [Chloroflexota bacterium]
MLEYATNFFLSGFIYPGILWHQVLIGIGLGMLFGAIWFTSYWTPILLKPWAWAIMTGSAILAWTAAASIQIPLQIWAGQILGHFWNQEILTAWVLIAGIPQILLSGLVQEGAKLVPVVIFWWRNDWDITPKLGLIIGATAGLGFGVFEAVWVHNTILTSGWSWEIVQSNGLIALAGFWERFFVIALHIAFSALAGYGLAKGWGWQFYLLASFSHGFLNYSAVLLRTGIFTVIGMEIFVAVLAVLFTSLVLWLKWKEPPDIVEV